MGHHAWQSAAPERSLVQRMEALQRANEIRVKRAAMKKELKKGKGSVAEVLINPPEFMESMKVYNLLRCAPKVGDVKARKILQVCRVSPSKTIGRPGDGNGGLSDRQRAEIVSMIRR